MKSLVISLGSIVLLSLGAARAEEIDPAARLAAERIAVTTCATCHGPQGHSYSPKFPVLAGQHANYLAAQLEAFKAQTRGDADAVGYMWGMASPLDSATIAALSDYYSQQHPTAGPRSAPALVARGKQIYQQGDSAKGIPPCSACHGPDAAGTDAFPRLAGQHVQYLMKQLRSFQNNMRNVAVMHGVAQGLQREDMLSIASYLQSLP
jgi:cytochrome c553